MSSHVVVIATDLRRANIKVSPGTYLTDVLEEACNKFNIASEKYSMKHKQKQLDLSHQFRTSGLVPGAKLELVQKSKTPSAVQVGLQVPLLEGKEIPGGRLIQKFPSNLTLWQVLRQFESGEASNGRNINITARGVAQTIGGGPGGSGQLYYETPVLNIMGRELSSFSDFQKTLSQLGYNSGSVLIRLTYKISGQTLFEAMEEIGEYFKQGSDAEEKTAPTATNNTELEVPSSEPTHDTTMSEAPTELTNTGQEQTEPHHEPRDQPRPVEMGPPTEAVPEAKSEADPYQPAHVFLAPTGSAPAAALAAPDDSDYVPTVAHAQLHQARLQEKSRNKRLLSDKELEEKAAAEDAKLAAVKSVVVKVRFPDQTSSDWSVGQTESGAFLYEAVRHVMARPEQPFRLVISGEKRVIKDDSSKEHNLVRGYKLSGRVLVNLVWEDAVPNDVRKQPFLKSNIAQKGEAVKVPDLPQAVTERATAPAGPATEPPKQEKSRDGVEKKLAKFLKLGKK